ncbi:hypothetical protein EWM64_g10266 [Hericium alpestre]|uniref:Uncharacterized protein n=1 Tax=Hericium alpestre TaxID=135208 RepID=A0A4Y9ZG59_9AGAM|nr:hypothetical protein EWM64_g10266 [Hericium alpestre]
MRKPLEKTSFLCQNILLDDAEFLEIIDASGVDLFRDGVGQFWHHAFSRCTNVRQVKLDIDCGIEGFCDALIQDIRDPDASSSGDRGEGANPILFPNLSSLTVTASFKWTKPRDAAGFASPPLCEIFLEMLTLRAERAPLHELDLCDSFGFDKAWIDCVKAIVPIVKVEFT